MADPSYEPKIPAPLCVDGSFVAASEIFVDGGIAPDRTNRSVRSLAQHRRLRCLEIVWAVGLERRSRITAGGGHVRHN